MASKRLNKSYKGKKFHKLTVISDHWSESVGGKKGNSLRFVKVKCDCGHVKKVRLTSLLKMKERYCKSNCPKRKYYPKNKKIYAAYNDMRGRCYNKNRDRYKSYGGRGIRVCSFWLKSYKSFENWALKCGYEDGLTLDRIDVNKDYHPENCRWVTKEEQGFNKRNTLWIRYKGQNESMAKLCKLHGVSYRKAYYRCITNKMPFEEYLKLAK